MTPEDIMRIDPKICILIIRGIKPFKDTKFEYANHKNYKYTADADII
jgi:type IV secretory pathway TraG/TraD family ATPase VirD4